MDLRRRILSSGEIDVRDCSPNCPTLPSPPPSPSSSAGSLPHFLIALISLAAAALFFAAVYYFVLSSRRRRLGRPILPVPPRLDGPGDGAGSEDEGGAVDHHVWNIRTVGLDDRAIASIGTSEYRRVAAAGPAADCSVCLGELRDGELVRLLPACGHPFHVPCIDTWLKAHVSCPLCRAHVAVPPAAAGEDTQIPLPALEVEEEGLAVEPLPELPEGSESRPPVVGLEESGLEPVRRSFSMDFSLGEERKEATFVGQSLGENSGKKGNIEIGRSLSSSGRGFFFSRLGRGRSNSVLPL